MKRFNIIIAAVALYSLTGCSIFGKFADETAVPENLYGENIVGGNFNTDTSVGEMSWREFFSDPKLQTLIDSALVRNVDLKAAGVNVEQAAIVLKSAKLSFIPMLSFSPSISITPDNGYSLPLSGSWTTPGFGSLTNNKRMAEASAMLAIDNEKDVRSRMVATIAKAYSQLQLLDRQYEIIKITEKLWAEVLETQQALMENGRAYSTSVNQMKASLLGVTIQKMDVENSISDMENVICRLLRQTPQHVDRSGWESFGQVRNVGIGIPAQLLENRADVRAARHNLEVAFYNTNLARSAMLPDVTLSGLIGWGNEGGTISDPLSLVYNAVGSLTQPIFAQGKIRGNIKISKLEQQLATDQYAQTIVNAGNEVNDLLGECQLSNDKKAVYKEQIEALSDAYSATQELMKNGKATYIEVLTAQEALLRAQLDEAGNTYSGWDAMISLYLALGGGTY